MRKTKSVLLENKINELTDSFRNLKDYCLYNNLDLLAQCEKLLKEAENLKNQLEQKPNIPHEVLLQKVKSLNQNFEKLRKEFS